MTKPKPATQELSMNSEEWRQKLSPERYFVLREGGTERPFSGELLTERRAGEYHCAGCGSLLFKADSKFDAGCGWPSFSLAETNAIRYLQDTSHSMIRTEIRCQQCDGHLGHVFNDGPAPTGQRYCVNSLALEFNAKSGE